MNTNTPEYNRILVALDIYSSYYDVLNRAINLATKPDDISLVFVTLSASGLQPYVNDSGDSMVAVIRTQATIRLFEIAKKYDIDCGQIFLPVGSPAQEISAIAGRIDADLVVVGFNSDDPPEPVIGSTTKSLLHNLSCDVLVVSSS